MTESCRSERGRSLFLDPGALPLILLSALVAFMAAAVAARDAGHITLPLPYLAIDVAMVAYMTAVLAILQRRRILGGVLALVIGNGLLIGSCVKTALLGHPGTFADLLLLPDLMQVLDPTLAFGAGAMMLALLGAYIINLGGPRSFAERCLLVPLLTIGIFAGLLAASPSLARSAALSVPYRSNQVYSYFLHAYTAYVTDMNWEHAERVLREESVATLRTAPVARAVLPPFVPRNVHVVVAESFTDPAWYSGFGLGDAPLAPLFERWRKAGRSTAVSPVFGGRSANAEFEVLCGLPALVGPSEIVFWRLPSGPLPCLPERLAEAGYATFALHPIGRETFNLDHAYPSAGFERTYFESDLDMSDRDGRFLSARSTLMQHLMRVEAALEAERPVFSYAFVNAAHFPYARDETERPALLRAPTAPDPVELYVNAAAYMARAIDRYVSGPRGARPRERDRGGR